MINWSLLQPVDIGGAMTQGFQTGRAMVRQAQQQNALQAYVADPTNPETQNALAAYSPEFGMQLAGQRVRADAEARERSRVGGMFAQYGDNPSEGRRAALASGDMDLAKVFEGLDEDGQKRVAQFYKNAAPIAFKLRQVQDPAQRKAMLAEARPILLANGATPQMIDGFDVTDDASLDAIITSGSTVDQLIDRGKVTWHQQGEQPSFAVDYMGRPVGSQNPYRGSVSTPDNQHGGVQATLSAALPAPVVAGFLGNFHAEGGYGGAKGDGGSAAGIAQWRGERQSNFQRVIGKPVSEASPEEQARFVLWEMNNPEAAGMTVAQRDAILAAKTPGEAAALIDEHYEWSSGEHRDRRIAAAERFGAPVKVASKAEFDGLPSGTQFIAPDGSLRRKP